MRLSILISALLLSVALVGCQDDSSNSGTPTANNTQPTAQKDAGPLPNSGFKAELTLVEPPATMKAGQKATIRVRVKNVSDVQWYSHGGMRNTNPDNRFYLAAGNRWLKSDGKSLVTNMDGRRGLQRDLKPGEEEEVPLQITAPKAPGEYVLEVDLVQEQVAWFNEKGSPTAKAKITVVK